MPEYVPPCLARAKYGPEASWMDNQDAGPGIISVSRQLFPFVASRQDAIRFVRNCRTAA